MGKDETMPITTEQVKHLVDSVAYKPDWSFKMTDSSYSTAYCEVVYNTRETDPWNAPDYEEHRTPFTREFTIDCDRCESEVEVCRILLEEALSFEVELLGHEAREFFRVKHLPTWENPTESWDAPFHPHHYDRHEEHRMGNGAHNWDATSHRQKEENKNLSYL